MSLEQLPNRESFLSMFSTSVHAKIDKALSLYPDALGLCVFECQQMDSSHFGDRSALVIGPSNTFKTFEECEGKWLKDLPSERQYAVAYITKENYFHEDSKKESIQ